MRVSGWVLALPALAAAQQQVPFMDRLKGMYDQGVAAFQKAAATASHPAQAASDKAAQHSVTALTFDNWKSEINHSGRIKQYDPPEAFMVFITGGNHTCYGKCGRANRAWNDSIPWFVQDISAPKLYQLDCEKEELLCGAWAAEVPSIWMILRPQPRPADQPPPSTALTIFKLNITSVDDSDITNIHTRREYLAVPPYEGMFHPWDGAIAKLGLTTPMAMTLFYMSKVPNWAFMIGLSLFSRYFVSKRMPRPQSQAGSSAASAPS